MAWAQIAGACLDNAHVRLRPFTAEDREPLRKVAMAPQIWRFFLTRIDTPTDYDAFFDTALADQAAGRRISFCITDNHSGLAAGSMCYGNMAEPDQRLEIGWSWLGLDFQGKGINRWAKYLLMEHAFERMGAQRVEFKTDELNVQARKGLCNIGAVEEGTLRSYNPMPGGRRRNAVFYSVLSGEWPYVKEQLSAHPKVAPRSAG